MNAETFHFISFCSADQSVFYFCVCLYVRVNIGLFRLDHSG